MSNKDVIISAAKESDIPEIIALVRELAIYEKLLHLLSATEEDYRECLFGKNTVAEALVARKGAEAVGYAIFFRNFSTFLGKAGIYLEDIFVLPQYRGQGIGKKLLATVAAIAQERQCGRLEWSVLDWNKPSIDFYRSIGATGLDEWTIFRMDQAAIANLAQHGARVPMNVYDRVLIIGHRGMLAGAIARQLKSREIAFVGVDRDTFDVTDRKQVTSIFRENHPTLVFNCAAATNVDGCETDFTSAEKLNGAAVGFLAEMAAQNNTKLVHYSTDFVFDGEKEGKYSETDQTNPLSAYGKTKLLGEENLRKIKPPGYLLLRTAWLYGRPGKCFPRTMVELAGKGIDPLKVVADQHGCPTLTDDLAAATLELIDKNAGGLFHATNTGRANWREFAEAAIQQWGLVNRVDPLSSDEWKKMKPLSAHRPRNSVLDLTKIQNVLGRPMRPWQEALADYHEQVVHDGF